MTYKKNDIQKMTYKTITYKKCHKKNYIKKV